MNSFISVVLLLFIVASLSYARHDYRSRHHGIDKDNDLSLWINEQQVKVFSGFSMKVYAIDNGKVNPHVRDKVSADPKSELIQSNWHWWPQRVDSVSVIQWESEDGNVEIKISQSQVDDNECRDASMWSSSLCLRFAFSLFVCVCVYVCMWARILHVRGSLLLNNYFFPLFAVGC